MGAYLEEDLTTQQFNPGIVVNNGTDLYYLKFQIDNNDVES
jgi:hypothetical protein